MHLERQDPWNPMSWPMVPPFKSVPSAENFVRFFFTKTAWGLNQKIWKLENRNIKCIGKEVDRWRFFLGGCFFCFGWGFLVWFLAQDSPGKCRRNKPKSSTKRCPPPKNNLSQVSLNEWWISMDFLAFQSPLQGGRFVIFLWLRGVENSLGNPGDLWILPQYPQVKLSLWESNLPRSKPTATRNKVLTSDLWTTICSLIRVVLEPVFMVRGIFDGGKSDSNDISRITCNFAPSYKL